MSEPPAAPSRAPLPVVGGIGLAVALLAILMLAKLDWLHGVREWWSGDKRTGLLGCVWWMVLCCGGCKAGETALATAASAD